MIKPVSFAFMLAAALGPLLSGMAFSQTLSTPTYSAAQAKRGQAAYMDHCASCHGPHLNDGQGDGAPALAGPDFASQWNGKSLDAVFTAMSTEMPLDAPGSLEPATYADVLAFILSQNGVAPSATDLPSDSGKLKGMATTSGK